MAKERSDALNCASLMARKRWAPLPAVAALHGGADFFKAEIVERFIRELFPEGTEPWVRRYGAGDREPGKPALAEVLDDLRTPSFLSPSRLVVVEAADQFVTAHRDALEPFVAQGFAGGHLILLLESLDLRTRFGKSVSEKGWAVLCQKPYDRPPPWETSTEAWDNDLSRWLSARAKGMGLVMDLEMAHAFSQRVGSDLATLAEEMEKLRTYLGEKGGAVDLRAVEAVAGELREDSIFDLVDAFLGADRPGALRILRRLFQGGYHPPKGAAVQEPVAISSMFIGALVSRLRSLRRAHALAGDGKGADSWLALRLTSRPFLPRFQRDLTAMPPRRIARAFADLREIDRAVKTGSRPEPLLESFILKN